MRARARAKRCHPSRQPARRTTRAGSCAGSLRVVTGAGLTALAPPQRVGAARRRRRIDAAEEAGAAGAPPIAAQREAWPLPLASATEASASRVRIFPRCPARPSLAAQDSDAARRRRGAWARGQGLRAGASAGDTESTRSCRGPLKGCAKGSKGQPATRSRVTSAGDTESLKGSALPSPGPAQGLCRPCSRAAPCLCLQGPAGDTESPGPAVPAPLQGIPCPGQDQVQYLFLSAKSALSRSFSICSYRLNLPWAALCLELPLAFASTARRRRGA